MCLSSALQPFDDWCRLASVYETLECVRSNNDVAEVLKALKNSQPVFVEVLRFINQDEGKCQGNPLLNRFVL